MKTKHEILCATDLEHGSLAAESVAYKFAKQAGDLLTLFHADASLLQFHEYYAFGGMILPPALGEKMREKIESEITKKLEHRRHAIGGAEDRSLQTRISAGHPAPEILKYLQHTPNQVDMVVLSKRKRTFFGEFFLGSVAQRVIEQAKCPVLLVPDKEDIFLAWQPKNVLVATSLEEGSQVAVKFASELARSFGSAITLLHVIPNTSETLKVSQLRNLSTSEKDELSALFASQEEIARKLIENEKAKTDLGANVSTCVRGGGTTATILEVAEEIKADLVIVGAYSKDGQVALGSVAATLARAARTPLLIVRH